MVTKINYKHFWVLIIFTTAFLVRIYNLSFPAFTSDEARIAYRGYTLATSGRDELGRLFPILFNSLTDYQFPVVSYFSAAGILLFGKNDFGARIPFIITSIFIAFLIYKISGVFHSSKEFRLFSTSFVVFSPMLIFLSRIPNETIILTFSLLLLFFLLTRNRINLLAVGSAVFFALLISKNAWWVTMPFVIYTLTFFRDGFSRRTGITILFTVLVLIVSVIVIFLQIPQAKRSLLENNLSIFQDTSIKVAVNTLRGQGLEVGLPDFLERILFNKLQLITLGFLNWVFYLQPTFLFSQFDSFGNQGFAGTGILPKILLIPFVTGFIIIIRGGNKKAKALIFFPLVLTFPLFFTYPTNNWGIIVTILPFLVFIISLGLIRLNNIFKYLIVCLAVIEVSINLIFISPEVKNASKIRPVWIKELAGEVYNLSNNQKIAISDDLVPDIVPFLEWFYPIKINDNFMDIQFPYRFHQMDLSNMKIIGSNDTFYFCKFDKPVYVFASRRDLEKIQRRLSIDTAKTTVKIYLDNLGDKIVYELKPTICIH